MADFLFAFFWLTVFIFSLVFMTKVLNRLHTIADDLRLIRTSLLPHDIELATEKDTDPTPPVEGS